MQTERRDPSYVKALEKARESARHFSYSHVRPRALEIDGKVEADHTYFDWQIVRAGLPYRLLSMAIPNQVGGTNDGNIAAMAIVMEELCASCAGVATIFGAHALGISPLLIAGMGHWDSYLAEIAQAERRGEPILMAFAITEPSAGTDVESPDLIGRASLNTAARKVKGGYRLSGRKCFISNGNLARWITVFMPLDVSRPQQSWTCFLVDTKDEGFSTGRVEHKLGQRACPAAEIVLDDVFVPKDCLIGREGDGMAITMLALATSRPAVGAVGTGIARGAYERLLAWAQSSRPDLLEMQYFQLALARMETDIHLARQAYLDAVMELDIKVFGPLMQHPLIKVSMALPRRLRTLARLQRALNSRRGREGAARLMRSKLDERTATRTLALSSMAKVVGADVAVSVTNSALELAGLDAGPLRAELEKLWRDAKLTQIYEGTNQLNLLEVYHGLTRQGCTEMLPAAGSSGGRP